MSDDVDDLWVLAMEHAAGREEPPVEAHADLVALARRIVSTGRRVASLPACPSAVLHRALAIADAAPVGRLVRLWGLLFDSWAAPTPAPAMRGGTKPRLLRYGGDGGAMDLEMAAEASGAMRLRGTVDAPAENLSVEVAVDDRPPLRVPVLAGGLFEVVVPAGGRGVVLTLRRGRRVLARTPPLPPSA